MPHTPWRSTQSNSLPVSASNGYRVRTTVQSESREDVYVFNRSSPVVVVEYEPGYTVVTLQPTRSEFRGGENSFRLETGLLSEGIPRYPGREPITDSAGQLEVVREDSKADTVVLDTGNVRIPIVSFDFAGAAKSDVLLWCPAGLSEISQVMEVEI